MADIKVEDKRPFEFKAGIVTSGQTETLEVDVRNVSGAVWDGFLLIELKLRSELMAPPVQQAARDARTSIDPANMATLAGVVTAAEGWSVWAINDPNDPIVVIRVFNDTDQLTAQPTETITPLGAGAVLKLRIPLKPEAAGTQFEMEYGYQTGADSDTRVDGSLLLTPSRVAELKPRVTLTCKHTSPTMIKPGAEVEINWSVENGVAATLRGPLPGGNSELTLSRDKTANYRIDKGGLKIYAVGPMTYVLDAEVKGPDGQPNVQVVRTLALDIYSADKYGSLSVSPRPVLPNGRVKINWAVWGVEKASLSILNRKGIKLTLTEQNLSRTYQGFGTWHVHASAVKEVEHVSLDLVNAPETGSALEKTIKVVKWQPTLKPAFTGQPVALAVAGGGMALLTRDGLYTAPVGLDDDEELYNPVFEKSGETGKAWHALSALGGAFLVLRQTDDDDFVLERYDGQGQRVKLPVTLPGDFKAVALRGDAAFDLVGFGKRVYVVAEAFADGKWSRVVYSLDPDAEEPPRPEGPLAALVQYRFVTFDRALYAYHRGTGRMLRFGLTKEGGLDKPHRAAAAVNARGESMIKTGLLVPVGRVLVVLSPASFPRFDPLRIYAFLNVISLIPTNANPSRKPNEIPQDIVYNPQHDAWAACGHGLDVKAGAVAAFRGGTSERLWVLLPEGEMHTLSEAGEALFAPDFIDKLHSLPLPPVLDGSREFTLVNLSGVDLVPVDSACREAGFVSLSANGPAELTPAEENFPNAANKRFTLSYNKAETTTATLRFMAANPPGVRYLLEMSFSGEGFSQVTIVFKRLGRDGKLADIPGTLKQHPAGETSYTLAKADTLLQRKRLFIVNATTHDLNVYPREGSTNVPDSAWVEVAYNTPELYISIPSIEKVGMFSVNFDLTLPFGIEMSPGREPQRKMMRVNTDRLHMLDVKADLLNKFFTTVGRYYRYDGSEVLIGAQSEDVCGIRVGLKTKRELDGIRLGDAVLGGGDSRPLYIPLANSKDTSDARVGIVRAGDLTFVWDTVPTRGWVYDLPNGVAASEDKVFAIFGDTTLYENERYLLSNWEKKKEFADYKQIAAIAATPGGDIFMVARKNRQVGRDQLPFYSLLIERADGQSKVIPLDNFKFPDNVAGSPVNAPPLAVSPDGTVAAVCHIGGYLTVDLKNSKIVPVNVNSAREPAHVVFSPDGVWLYSAHVTRVMSNDRGRRAVAGRDIVVSRLNVWKMGEPQTVALPNVESDFGLTGNTMRKISTLIGYKEDVALTLAPSPDKRSLFVSAGKSIMKIDLSSFTLLPWRAEVELPCRLIFVHEGRGNAFTVYALSSYYYGDGTTVEQNKTHLYAVPAPK